MTDAEHRALDERLDILSWGLALLVFAIILIIPGTNRLWHFLTPFGLVFIGMSVVRKLIPTRRDTEGLILGIAATVVGLIDLFGVNLSFFPLLPTVLAIVGIALIFNALVSNRVRRDPERGPEGGYRSGPGAGADSAQRTGTPAAD